MTNKLNWNESDHSCSVTLVIVCLGEDIPSTLGTSPDHTTSQPIQKTVTVRGQMHVTGPVIWMDIGHLDTN